MNFPPRKTRRDTNIGVRLSSEDKLKLYELSQAEGRTVSDYAHRIIKKYLAELKAAE